MNHNGIPDIVLNKNGAIDLFKLSNIILPFSTLFTILAKLSSVIIISAASFATSSSLIPITAPISAFFDAGESLTPSLVHATIQRNVGLEQYDNKDSGASADINHLVILEIVTLYFLLY